MSNKDQLQSSIVLLLLLSLSGKVRSTLTFFNNPQYLTIYTSDIKPSTHLTQPLLISSIWCKLLYIWLYAMNIMRGIETTLLSKVWRLLHKRFITICDAPNYFVLPETLRQIFYWYLMYWKLILCYLLTLKKPVLK